MNKLELSKLHGKIAITKNSPKIGFGYGTFVKEGMAYMSSGLGDDLILVSAKTDLQDGFYKPDFSLIKDDSLENSRIEIELMQSKFGSYLFEIKKNEIKAFYEISSNEKYRKNLKSISFFSNGIASTNAQCLLYKQSNIDIEIQDCELSILIPREVFEIAKSYSKEDYILSKIDEKTFVLEGEINIFFRKLNQKYPCYLHVIPKNETQKRWITKQYLKESEKEHENRSIGKDKKKVYFLLDDFYLRKDVFDNLKLFHGLVGDFELNIGNIDERGLCVKFAKKNEYTFVFMPIKSS